jgi:hypothetical protein
MRGDVELNAPLRVYDTSGPYTDPAVEIDLNRGLPELIAQNIGEYEALALELALNSEKLLSLKQKLAANRLTHPLFDTVLFTKHIESAYAAMWKQHQAGFAPQNIYVRP